MARRKTEVFSMSFLDCITCAFGSVVLVYVLINARGGLRAQAESQSMLSDVKQLEQQVLEGYQNLLVMRNTMEMTDEERARMEGMSARILKESEKTKVELADADQIATSRREAIERLKADLKQMEEGQKRLEGAAKSKAATGSRVVGIKGDGDRLYLTGLKVSGKHILILMDVSASMLDETVVNVLRMRNMSEPRKLLAEKWQRALSTTEWVAAQLPDEAQFQLFAFNTKAWPMIEGSATRWLNVNDKDSVNDSLSSLRKIVPGGGTSLENAFLVMNTLSPKPDSVILITDGLPTQGVNPPLLRKTVDGDRRLELFQDSLKRVPKGVRINTILLPMEGDPSAPSAFWLAARRTGGSFLMPSKDWP
jgi:von Willebrand factor type A domain